MITLKKNIFIIFIISFLFSACSLKKADLTGKKRILCTYFPQYDWTRSITGGLENESIQSLLIKNGLDFHYYTPDQNDFSQLKQSDLIILIGGPSDEWILNTLKTSPDFSENSIKILNLYNEIEKVTGQIPVDEHIWMSFKYAQICCKSICNSLKELIPENKEKYEANCSDYLEQIQSLDATYASVIKNLPDKSLVVADRFPFHYLIEDYNLKCFSVLQGCSASTEATETEINHAAKTLSNENLNSIFILEDSDKKISKAVILAAKKPRCDTYMLNSLQCISLQESMGKTNYLTVMRTNLETIQKALKD